MHPGLEHDLAVPLGIDRLLHGMKDLLPGEAEPLDIGCGDKPNSQLRHMPRVARPPAPHAAPGRGRSDPEQRESGWRLHPPSVLRCSQYLEDVDMFDEAGEASYNDDIPVQACR